MSPQFATAIRSQLEDRQRRLRRAIREDGQADDFVQLLGAIDDAISRLEGGRLGTCVACGEAVDDDVLLANPLIEYCLCQLSEAQLAALQYDLNLARRTQLALLPKQDLSVAGWDVHFRYQPAGPVSGDYLDVVARGNPPETLYFLLGDVSGKGVAASLAMARLNALLRSLIEQGPHVAELVAGANHLFTESRIASHFATLVAVEADAHGELEICNAGQCPPVMVGSDGAEVLEVAGLPVGLSDEEAYDVHSSRLEPGETLFLYSDGLTEAMDEGGQQYGIQNVARVLGENHALPPARLAAACLADLASFQNGTPRHDDLSIMVIRRTG